MTFHRALPRSLWTLALLPMLSCEAVWGSFDAPNERNCIASSMICATGFVCDKVSQTCVKTCTSYTDCTGAQVCHNESCVSCGMLSPADVVTECGKLPPVTQLKACFQDTCVQCVDSSQCASDSACGADHQCTNACVKHEDCQSDVCDVYQTNTKGTLGKCLATESVAYVDNKNGSCMGQHAGTQGDPFCVIGDALGKGKSAVRVMPSTQGYGSVKLTSGTLALYGGFGTGMDTLLGRDSTTAGLDVSGNAVVTADGVVVDTSLGVRCSMGTLSLRRTRVINSTSGSVYVNSCIFTMDRGVISGGSLLSALSMTNGTRYNVTNSFIVGNASGASNTISIGLSTGRFRFNTVAGNGGNAVALDCGEAARDIEDSIIFGNPAPSMTQFTSNCTLMGKSTVGGTAEMAMGVIHLDPEFVGSGDYHLKDSPANVACCIDKGSNSPDIKTDSDGTIRPQRQGYDIGAHEVK